MRYRAQDANGDYTFGPGSTFLIDSPACVAQAVETRLRLFAREWFLDKREGVDKDRILGYHTSGTRDQEIQERIIGTPGVRALLAYQSNVDADTRAFTVTATLETIYGAVIVTTSF